MKSNGNVNYIYDIKYLKKKILSYLSVFTQEEIDNFNLMALKYNPKDKSNNLGRRTNKKKFNFDSVLCKKSFYQDLFSVSKTFKDEEFEAYINSNLSKIIDVNFMKNLSEDKLKKLKNYLSKNGERDPTKVLEYLSSPATEDPSNIINMCQNFYFDDLNFCKAANIIATFNIDPIIKNYDNSLLIDQSSKENFSQQSIINSSNIGQLLTKEEENRLLDSLEFDFDIDRNLDVNLNNKKRKFNDKDNDKQFTENTPLSDIQEFNIDVSKKRKLNDQVYNFEKDFENDPHFIATLNKLVMMNKLLKKANNANTSWANPSNHNKNKKNNNDKNI
jgi:hypothetical protein